MEAASLTLDGAALQASANYVATFPATRADDDRDLGAPPKAVSRAHAGSAAAEETTTSIDTITNRAEV